MLTRYRYSKYKLRDFYFNVNKKFIAQVVGIGKIFKLNAYHNNE